MSFSPELRATSAALLQPIDFLDVLHFAQMQTERNTQYNVLSPDCPEEISAISRKVSDLLGVVATTCTLAYYEDDYQSTAHFMPEGLPNATANFALLSLSNHVYFYTFRQHSPRHRTVERTHCTPGTLLSIAPGWLHKITPPLEKARRRHVAFFGAEESRIAT